MSWSHYLDQLATWFDAHVEAGWSGRIRELQALLADGDATQQMMQVTGEEGITLEDFVTHQKAVFLDMVYLQQDAFDPVDASVSLDRQKESLSRVHALVSRAYAFPSKEAAREHFTRLTGLLKNLNYADAHSPAHAELLAKIETLSASAP
jgi:V/A-type H+-transporting ATPase subunit A